MASEYAEKEITKADYFLDRMQYYYGFDNELKEMMKKKAHQRHLSPEEKAEMGKDFDKELMRKGRKLRFQINTNFKYVYKAMKDVYNKEIEMKMKADFPKDLFVDSKYRYPLENYLPMEFMMYKGNIGFGMIAQAITPLRGIGIDDPTKYGKRTLKAHEKEVRKLFKDLGLITRRNTLDRENWGKFVKSYFEKYDKWDKIPEFAKRDLLYKRNLPDSLEREANARFVRSEVDKFLQSYKLNVGYDQKNNMVKVYSGAGRYISRIFEGEDILPMHERIHTSKYKKIMNKFKKLNCKIAEFSKDKKVVTYIDKDGFLVSEHHEEGRYETKEEYDEALNQFMAEKTEKVRNIDPENYKNFSYENPIYKVNEKPITKQEAHSLECFIYDFYPKTLKANKTYKLINNLYKTQNKTATVQKQEPVKAEEKDMGREL